MTRRVVRASLPLWPTVIFLGVAALPGGPDTAAAQELRGLQLVQASSRTDTTQVKRAVAQCPAGTTIVGGGGRVFSPPPDDGRANPPPDDGVVLSESAPGESIPGAGLNSWAVTAVARNPRSRNWFVTASALCAEGSLGLQLFKWSSRADRANFKRAFANCPARTTVVAGGGRVFAPPPDDGLAQPPPDDGLLHVSVPSADRDGWAITAVGLTPRARRWGVTAFALCGPEVPGLQVFQWSSRADTATFKRAFANCPAGTTVVAGGGRVFVPRGPGGRPAAATPPPDDGIGFLVSTPSLDLDGWAVTAVALHRGSRNWFVTAYAVCAPTG
jgi:hypothetical protein